MPSCRRSRWGARLSESLVADQALVRSTGEPGDRSTDRAALQRSVAGRTGHQLGRPPRHRGLPAALLGRRGRGHAARRLGWLRARAAASRPLRRGCHPDPLRPWGPERPRGRKWALERRPKGLPGQAGGHHDVHRGAPACRGAPRQQPVGPGHQGPGQRRAPRQTWRASRSRPPRAIPGRRSHWRTPSAPPTSRSQENGPRPTRTGRSPASNSSETATKRTSTPSQSPRTAS